MTSEHGTNERDGMRRIEAIIDGPFRHSAGERMVRDQYHEACGLNPSSIKKESPLHVKHEYENCKRRITDAMQLGTAVHTLVWEPDLFTDQVVCWEGDRRGNAWKAFAEENADKLILKAEGEYSYERAIQIASKLTAEPRVKELAREGLAETAVFTEECGLQCRGLLDWLATHCATLADLKVVRSIVPRRFGNAVQEYGWDVSMACYRRWFQREANKEIKAVKFIAVESSPPFDVAVVDVPEAALELGWKKASAMIERVRESIETGVWPGIAGGEEVELFVPTYAMDEEQIEWEDAA